MVSRQRSRFRVLSTSITSHAGCYDALLYLNDDVPVSKLELALIVLVARALD